MIKMQNSRLKSECPIRLVYLQNSTLLTKAYTYLLDNQQNKTKIAHLPAGGIATDALPLTTGGIVTGGIGTANVGKTRNKLLFKKILILY